MPESMRFVVTIPKNDLETLALNEDLGDTPSTEQLCQVLRGAIMAGFEEYTGEEVSVSVSPMS